MGNAGNVRIDIHVSKQSPERVIVERARVEEIMGDMRFTDLDTKILDGRNISVRGYTPSGKSRVVYKYKK